MKKEIFGSLILSLLVAGCNYRIEKSPAIVYTGQFKAGTISYDTVRQEVFLPKCIGCHGNSGGVNLETYEAVRSHIDAISRSTLREKRMPKDSALSSIQLGLLAQWIAEGAPEKVQNPTPTPPPEPLVPTYSSIRKNIFVPKCLSCHVVGGQATGVPLGTYEEVIDSPREIVIPGNAEESGLMIALTRTDSKRMPPPNVGSSLGDTEIGVIETWIKNNAPKE